MKTSENLRFAGGKDPWYKMREHIRPETEDSEIRTPRKQNLWFSHVFKRERKRTGGMKKVKPFISKHNTVK